MVGLFLLTVLVGNGDRKINRRMVVERHAPRFSHANGHIDPIATGFNALTVGNGEFAFTADLTGLQSLNTSYDGHGSFPLLTMSNWGWHTPHPSTLGVSGIADVTNAERY